MKALVHHGPGKKTWEDRPKPTLKDPTDAIVRVAKTILYARMETVAGAGPRHRPGCVARGWKSGWPACQRRNA
jgi:alcohol dehydrogenase